MDEMMKKKMKVCLVGCNSRSAELPVDFLFQVFLTLPIQHLLKCMFVSKFWCSIIRQPTFIQVYCSRNPLFLLLCISFVDDTYGVSMSRSIYCPSILSCGKQGFFNLFNFSMTKDSFCFHGATQIINGFFCAYIGNRLSLVNVFDGKVTDLPCPPNLRSNAKSHYYFGFEPISGLYKLLCIDYSNFWERCELQHEGTLFNFYILTISRSDQEFSWRRLRLPDEYDDQFTVTNSCISTNGTLYWFCERQPRYSIYRNSIRCFDLTKEEFVYLDPNVGEILRGDETTIRVVQFRGKLSLFYCKRRKMIIRSLEMDKSWTVRKATLPKKFRDPTRIVVGSLSTGQILLAYHGIENSITQVYAYDNKNKFKRIVVGKFPQSANLNKLTHLCCMEQNSEMLEALFRRFVLW